MIILSYQMSSNVNNIHWPKERKEKKNKKHAYNPSPSEKSGQTGSMAHFENQSQNYGNIVNLGVVELCVFLSFISVSWLRFFSRNYAYSSVITVSFQRSQ